ncbi:uncharacterized protein K444DRAFT_637426 [Hyaloscypha bicolor E]|uniref:DOMON domain-containing protein n=1 Tax=Hyaloscypha bicolor E TaxID=1095630 RepID=A0A2J6SN92_9HELO|nr:uncharacterized protein K444DRAFT_637426 [Hyaloscypha bicolor E]PMD52239.1 hypothetical protein K444DRAFT_637426 [Hyaloscypha bicolor E]
MPRLNLQCLVLLGLSLSQLFIGDPSHPVAVKVNRTSNSVLVAGNTAVQGKTTGPLVQSVGWVMTGWSVDNEKLSLGWTVAGMGNASFVYSNSNVWAVFGDVGADNFFLGQGTCWRLSCEGLQ